MAEPDDVAAHDGPAPYADTTMALLLRAAERYGMKTGATDWESVSRIARRAREATALLIPAALDLPLRISPARRP